MEEEEEEKEKEEKEEKEEEDVKDSSVHNYTTDPLTPSFQKELES